MLQITVRYPEEFVTYVRRLAKRRKIEESVIWRELVAGGITRNDMTEGLGKTALNLTVQTLCLTRRLAGHLDEGLISLANQDAKRTLEEIGDQPL